MFKKLIIALGIATLTSTSLCRQAATSVRARRCQKVAQQTSQAG